MSKKLYEKWKPQKRSLDLLTEIEKVLAPFEKINQPVTVRQVFYQLVAKKVIVNTKSKYDSVERVLKFARMGGLVDWDIIEDRLRDLYLPFMADNAHEALKILIDQFQVNKTKTQDVYVEVWIEKDAISSIVRRVTEKYNVGLLVGRGYLSVSALKEAAERINTKADSKECHVIYLGDHDPSGLHMPKKFKEVLKVFNAHPKINFIALTSGQVKTHNPPGLPVKKTDSRAEEYITKHGNICWELDTLKPDVLIKILEKKIESLLDMKRFKKLAKTEKVEKEKLVKLLKKVDK